MTDDALRGSLTDTMLNEAKNYEQRIEFDAKSLSRSARYVRMGAALGSSAPFVGFSIWLVVPYFLGV